MKYVLCLIMFVFLSETQAQDIKIIKASGQKRYGGTAGSGSHTIYMLKLLVPNKYFKAEGIWVKKQFYKEFSRDLKKGLNKDTLIINFTLKDSPSVKTKAISPIKLQYKRGKRRKLFPINEIETLSPEHLP
jgi:hypothetical protein